MNRVNVYWCLTNLQIAKSVSSGNNEQTSLHVSSNSFNRNIAFFSAMLVLSFLLFSCKSKKEISRKEIKDLLEDSLSTSQLLSNMKKNEFTFETLSIKATVETQVKRKTNSFKATIRMRKDSAIWMSVTPLLGIEVARMLVTPDTVLFIDRIHQRYFTGNFSVISQLFHVDLDFDMLQSLLLGNSIAFEENEKIISQPDRHMFFLGTTKKRKVKKAIKKDKESKLKDDTQSIWLDPFTFKIRELFITDNKSEQSLRAVYKNFQQTENQLFPTSLHFTVSSAQNTYLSVEYAKLSAESEITMPFSIPEKYSPVEVK